MKCKLKRFYKNVYCSGDFQYIIQLYSQVNFTDREFDKQDAGVDATKIYDIKCVFTKVNADFEINGEVINPRSLLNVVFLAFKREFLLELKKNIKKYFIIYNGQEYDINEADYENGDQRGRYFYLNCERRVNVIKSTV